MSSPIDVVLDMITVILTNTLGTLVNILQLLADLISSLGFSGQFGFVPFLISVLILGGVLFFVGKFFISSLKTIFLMFAAGFVILMILFTLA